MAQTERERLLDRRAKLDARLKTLDLNDQRQKRKDDTRRKIIAGSLILEHASLKPEVATMLTALLDRYVTRPQDRALFDFLPRRDDRLTAAAANSFAAVSVPASFAPSMHEPSQAAPVPDAL